MKSKFPVALLLLTLAAGCGATKEQIIQRTSLGLTAARSAYTTADEQAQMAIVSDSRTKDEAEKRLASYRTIRNAGTKAFQAAWTALAVASLDPSDQNMLKLSELASKAVLATKGDAP